jgi:hypothetical protein
LQVNPPYNGKAFIDLHNFDNQTGIVTFSTSINLNNKQKSYGVEFSPDNTKLYADCYDQSGPNAGNSEIIQYDLNAPVIAASGVTVGSSIDPIILRAMQAGPDNKIYVSKSNSPYLCVIKNPNAAGISCNYVDNAINVDSLANGAGCMLGLPNFVQSYFNPAFPDMGSCPVTPTISNPAGISENSYSEAIIYFDKSSQQLKFIEDRAEYGNFMIRIHDLLGKTITEQQVEVLSSTTSPHIDLSEIPRGIYIIKVTTGSQVHQQKFVK